MAARVLIAAWGSLLAARRVAPTIMRHVRHADPAGCICCAPLPVQLERDFFASQSMRPGVPAVHGDLEWYVSPSSASLKVA